MTYLQLDELPELRRPTFIAAFRGWNDACESATLAVRHLIESWSARPFAAIDPEEFFDFSVARPLIHITDEGQRDLQWPSNRFYCHQRPDADEDVVLLLGMEPHLRWRAFTETIHDLYERLQGARLVTLGALIAGTTHKRPPAVTGFATEGDLQSKLEGLTIPRSRYEGPTGIVGTLHDVWRRAQLPAASLWVGLPPYLGNSVNPRGALALLERLEKLFAFGVNVAPLVEASEQFEQQVDAALADNPEMKAYVIEMESQIAGGSEASTADLPPTSEIITDLEEFLRRQRGEE